MNIVHQWHDDGDVADPIMCEDIGGGWETIPFYEARQARCSTGTCICDEIERMRNG